MAISQKQHSTLGKVCKNILCPQDDKHSSNGVQVYTTIVYSLIRDSTSQVNRSRTLTVQPQQKWTNTTMATQFSPVQSVHTTVANFSFKTVVTSKHRAVLLIAIDAFDICILR